MTHIVRRKGSTFVLFLCCFTLTFDLYGAVKTVFPSGSKTAAVNDNRDVLTSKITLSQTSAQPEIQITQGKYKKAILRVSSLQIRYSASNTTWKEIKCILRGPTTNSIWSWGSVITKWNPCPSVINITNFKHEGPYHFTIHGVPEDEVESVKANSRWIIDCIPPRTRLSTRCFRHCTNNGKRFAFSGFDRNGIEAYECKLDTSPWFFCKSPYIAKVNETNGTMHTFQVRAIDNAGHVDPTPAFHTWNADGQAQSKVNVSRGGHSGPHSSHSSLPHSEGSHSERSGSTTGGSTTGGSSGSGSSRSGAASLKFTSTALYSLWPLWATLMWYLL